MEYSRVLWPSSLLLAHHLSKEPECSSLLELGAGLAIPSRVAHHLWPKCQIYLQDQYPLNLPWPTAQTIWGDDLSSLPITELILAADCLYDRASFTPFMETVSHLLHAGANRLLMVYHDRKHWIGGDMERLRLKAELISNCRVREAMQLKLPIEIPPLEQDCDPSDQLYLLEIRKL